MQSVAQSKFRNLKQESAKPRKKADDFGKAPCKATLLPNKRLPAKSTALNLMFSGIFRILPEFQPMMKSGAGENRTPVPWQKTREKQGIVNAAHHYAYHLLHQLTRTIANLLN